MKVIISKAEACDTDGVFGIYEDVCAEFKDGTNFQGWDINRYPTRDTAMDGIARGDLFVAKLNGAAVGTMVLNSRQDERYAKVEWGEKASGGEVMCIHTFCVSPAFQRRGVASQMLQFAQAHAKQTGAKTMRLDTSSINNASQKLYEGFGFIKRGSVDLGLDGLFGIKWYWCYDKKVD